MNNCGSNPDMYDGEHGKLTMAVFERLDYMKEHVPITPLNVDSFEKGFNRYSEKIEKLFQEYFEALSEKERKTVGSAVGKMLDRIDAGVRSMIADAKRHRRPQHTHG
jgi:hypothetical protein